MILFLFNGKSFPYVYQWSRITWAEGHIINWNKYIIVLITSHGITWKQNFQKCQHYPTCPKDVCDSWEIIAAIQCWVTWCLIPSWLANVSDTYLWVSGGTASCYDFSDNFSIHILVLLHSVNCSYQGQQLCYHIVLAIFSIAFLYLVSIYIYISHIIKTLLCQILITYDPLILSPSMCHFKLCLQNGPLYGTHPQRRPETPCRLSLVQNVNLTQ